MKTNLEQVRCALQLTQREAATEIGIPVAVVTKLESQNVAWLAKLSLETYRKVDAWIEKQKKDDAIYEEIRKRDAIQAEIKQILAKINTLDPKLMGVQPLAKGKGKYKRKGKKEDV